MRVLLAGEGRTELGEWAKEPAFRELPGEAGVLAALLERAVGNAIEVVDGVVWKNIRKYQAGRHASAEERNVLGLALDALRLRCDTVVFSRDRDGSDERHRDLDHGIQRARELFADLVLIGGIAIENIEGWILVLLGVEGESVSSRRTKIELETRFGIATVEAKVGVVMAASMHSLPAGSLLAWFECARAACQETGDA